MNDADKKAFEDWWPTKPHRNKYDSAHPVTLAAQEAWQAACEWRDSQAGEPVIYQCRTQPTWTDRQPWTPWSECTKGTYEDCRRVRVNGDWRYESRALYATPPAAQINQRLVQALEKIVECDADGLPVRTFQQREEIAKAALNAAKSGDV